MKLFNTLIKSFWPQWLALSLPVISTLILAVMCVAGLQQSLQQGVSHHQQQALVLQLDELSNQLTREQLAAWQQDLPQWDDQRRKTRATWQQLLGSGSAEDNTHLAPLKNSFNQLVWAQQNEQNSLGIDGEAYTPVLNQVATASRHLAGLSVESQHLVQLRQLHRSVQGLRLALKGILTHQAAELDGQTLLQQTQWLTQWMQPSLTDRQQRLFNELFDGGWQALRMQLSASLADNNPLDKNLNQELQELDTLVTALDTLLADSRDQLTQEMEGQTTALQNMSLMVWLLALLLPATGVLTLWLSLQRQASRLHTAQAWVQTLTCGNLTAQPEARLTGADPLGQMVLGVDELRHHWRRTLTQIHAHCDALQAMAHSRADWLDETASSPQQDQPPSSPSHRTPNRPVVDIPVLTDDFISFEDEFDHTPALNVGQYGHIQQHLTALNQSGQLLADSIAHWHGDTETLSQHMHQMTEPMQLQLRAVSAMTQQLQGLGGWVDTLNAYATKSQQLVDNALNHAEHLAHDEADLHQLQQEVNTMQQELGSLMQQLQQAQPPVITRMASQTGRDVKCHPWASLRRLLAEFSF